MRQSSFDGGSGSRLEKAQPGPLVAFVTYQGLPLLSDDDQLAASEFEARGFRVQSVIWDDPGVDWKAFAAVVLRSTWDYSMRLREFLSWIARMELLGVQLWNPSSVIFWNTSKTYLKELEAEGISIIPTAWLQARGTAEMLHELKGCVSAWERFEIKPAVSADGLRTHRFSKEELGWAGGAKASGERRAELESALADYEPGSMVLVQPFLEEVIREGEWSLLFYGERFSHAVLKRPTGDEFRIQSTYGGSKVGRVPPEGALAAAETVLAAFQRLRPGDLLYARVDLIQHAGQFLLGEVELVEPSLYFSEDVAAAGRFADACMRLAGEMPAASIALLTSIHKLV